VHGGQRGRESVFLVQQWQRWQPGTTLAQPLHDRAGGDGMAVTRACLHVRCTGCIAPLSACALPWALCSPPLICAAAPKLCCCCCCCHPLPQPLYETDSQLLGFRDHLDYRWSQFNAVRSNIETAEGSLEQFAKARGAYACMLHLRTCMRMQQAHPLPHLPPWLALTS
jgi:hypothetical protein